MTLRGKEAKLTIFIFCSPWKIGLKWHQKVSVAVFFPTNLDLANILGNTDLIFEKLQFWDVSGFQIPKIFKFPDWASSILLKYF